LGDAVGGDLRAVLGWPRRADEVAGFARRRDRWIVAGVRQGDDGRVASQRTWLWGEASGTWVVLLDFAAAGAALRVPQPVGSVVEDELVLHPGSEPQRAALSEAATVADRVAAPAASTVIAAVDRLAGWLAANPWRERLPVAVAASTLQHAGERWWLQDEAGDRLPVADGFEPWPMLAASGGHHSTVVAEWEAGVVHPLAVLVGEGGDAIGTEVVPL
jgi:hypothetical protein